MRAIVVCRSWCQRANTIDDNTRLVHLVIGINTTNDNDIANTNQHGWSVRIARRRVAILDAL